MRLFLIKLAYRFCLVVGLFLVLLLGVASLDAQVFRGGFAEGICRRLFRSRGMIPKGSYLVLASIDAHVLEQSY